MRDDGVDHEAVVQENRCRRAARSFAWWGRVAGALWVLEAVASGVEVLLFAPVWILTLAAEVLSPSVRRGRHLGPAAGVQVVALVVCAYCFWFAADGRLPGEPGRTLGLTFALTLLGARSTWLALTAWRLAPRPNPGRTPDEMRRHTKLGLAILLSGVSWSAVLVCVAVFLMEYEGLSDGLKSLVLVGLGLVVALHFSRLAARGSCLRFSVAVATMVSLVTIVLGALSTIQVPGVVGVAFLLLGGCHVGVAFLLTTGTEWKAERPPAPWEQRVTDDG